MHVQKLLDDGVDPTPEDVAEMMDSLCRYGTYPRPVSTIGGAAVVRTLRGDTVIIPAREVASAKKLALQIRHLAQLIAADKGA